MSGLQVGVARFGMTPSTGQSKFLPFAASALPAGWRGETQGISAGMYLVPRGSPRRLLLLVCAA